MSDIIGYHAVRLILPFGIPLPDDEYIVIWGRKDYRCRLQALPNPDFNWTADESWFITPVYDRRGRQYFTSAWVILPGRCRATEDWIGARNDGSQSELIGEVAVKDHRVEQAISAINQLINVYRHVSQEFHIPNVAYLDVNYTFGFADLETTDIHYARDVRDPDLSRFPRFRFSQSQQEIGRKVKEFLRDNKDVPINDELLLKAKEFFLWEDYRFALLCAVFALESVTSRFLDKIYTHQGKLREEINRILGMGRGGMSFIDRMDLVSNELDNLDRLPLEELHLSKCKESINLRNDIAHGKPLRDNLTLRNMDVRLLSIQAVIERIKERL